MDLNLEEIRLEVCGRRGSSDTDAESREGVERCDVARRLSDGFLGSSSSGDGGCGARGEPATNSLRLDAHPDEASKPEHDGDGDVLNLLRCVWIAWLRTETLHPGVGDTVHEDDQALDKLRGGIRLVRSTIPRPAEL